MQVSVIIATYYTDIEKLKKSLKSVIAQRDIIFEVIISDDGSNPSKEFIAEINDLFDEAVFKNYEWNINPVNGGTVKNILSAVKKAKGEYIYAMGPGDMLYSENTLGEWYAYVTSKKIDICFGIPKYFYAPENGTVCFDDRLVPEIPDAFNEDDNDFVLQEFIFGDRINGITYLRKREVFEEYLEKIAGKIKFVEDSSTTLLMLIDGIKVRFYPQPVAWYENGTGISTNNNPESLKRMKQDFDVLESLVIEKDKKYSKLFENNSEAEKLKRLKNNPSFTIKRKLYKNKEKDRYKDILLDNSKFPQYGGKVR